MFSYIGLWHTVKTCCSQIHYPIKAGVALDTTHARAQQAMFCCMLWHRVRGELAIDAHTLHNQKCMHTPSISIIGLCQSICTCAAACTDMQTDKLLQFSTFSVQHCCDVHPCLLLCSQAIKVVAKRQLRLVWRDKVLLRGRMLQVRAEVVGHYFNIIYNIKMSRCTILF